jgi:LysM repeat protein
LYNQFYELQETIIRESELKAEQLRIEIANRPKPRYYYVKKGDCIQLIAQKFDISNAELRSWNNLRGNVIHPHQKLRVSN